jgi:hypothetical protein
VTPPVLPLRTGRKAPHMTVYDATDQRMVAVGITAEDAAWIVERVNAAERAEAAVERVRALAEAAQERAAKSFSRDVTGKPFAASILTSDVLAALDKPAKETP